MLLAFDSVFRTAVRALFALAAVGATLAGCGSGEESGRQDFGPVDPGEVRAPPRDAPNFVLVIADDQDAASAGVMRTVTGPLAAAGATLDRFYLTTPECCPSRVSFLTGRYAHNHGVRSNVPPDGGFGAFEDSESLPVWLQRNGYETGFVGKYLNGYGWSALGHEPRYVPPGWSRWVVPANHTEYQMYEYDLNVDGAIRSFGREPADYQTDVFATYGARFIRKAQGRAPFFLTVAPVAPHREGVLRPDASRNPRPAPRHEGIFESRDLPRSPSFDVASSGGTPPFIGERESLTAADVDELTKLHRSRLESLLAVDDLVRDLLAELKRTGELRDTYFIYTSDNGFLLGQHRLKGKGVAYEEAVRVPFVIRGPGIPGGAHLDQLAANVDIAPTIADLAGVRAPAFDGLSMKPVLTESKPGDDGRALLLEMLEGRRFKAARAAEFVYIEHRTGEIELYDLARDPHQVRNVAGAAAYADVEAQMATALRRLRTCAGNECSVTVKIDPPKVR